MTISISSNRCFPISRFPSGADGVITTISMPSIGTINPAAPGPINTILSLFSILKVTIQPVHIA